MHNTVRTWIEIDTHALRHNLREFFKLIPENTHLMAVVKSNAYGHGFVQVAKQLANFQFSIFPPEADPPSADNFQRRLLFGVDSIVEAVRLRKEGIKNPILVLGSTLPSRMKEASEENIILTISNFDSLAAFIKLKIRPQFHIKIDTGMHRQGFLLEDIHKLIKFLKRFSAKGGSASGGKLNPQGIYTHFAAAKDILYPAYTDEQLQKFKKITAQFKRAGFRNFLRHASASGGTILFPDSHLDMVRIGMGMYGYFPSLEAKIEKENVVNLRPVLAWKTIAVEIKEIPAGSYVGYDLTERVSRRTKIAVLPVGYWHGYDRGLSNIGETLIRGHRSKVLGRVSMDMTVVDVTDISRVRVGDEAILLGQQGKETIFADDMALKIGTSPYEILTRINPLIRRMIV